MQPFSSDLRMVDSGLAQICFGSAYGTGKRVQLQQPEMVGILGLQRADQNLKLWELA